MKEDMRLAIELAQAGCGWVSPNPMVGAVIVKDGRIIGQGYHKRYGEPSCGERGPRGLHEKGGS